MALSEILAVLADEMVEVEEVVKLSVVGLPKAKDESTFTEHIDSYTEQLERMTSVAEMLELPGLAKISEFVQTNLDLIKFGDKLTTKKLHVFEAWPQLFISYLSIPKEGVYSEEISSFFLNPDWPQPFDEKQAAQLNKDLLVVSKMDGGDKFSKPARQTQVTPEDLSLAFPEDINPVLFEAFLTEGPTQAMEFSEVIQKFALGKGDIEDVDQVRRIIHNIKGSANTVDVRGIATFAHNIEDILDYCIDNAYIPKDSLASLLVESADAIEVLYERIIDGHSTAPEHAAVVLQLILDTANQIDAGIFSTDADSVAEASADTATAADEIVLEEDKEKYAEDAEQDADIAIDDSLALDDEITDEAEVSIDNIPPPAPPPEKIQKPAAIEVVTPTFMAPTASATPQSFIPISSTEEPKKSKEVGKLAPKVRVSVEAIDEMLRFSGEMAISRSHIQERLQQSKKMLSDYRERDEILWERINKLDELIATQGVESVKHYAIADGGQQIASALDPLEMDQYNDMHMQVQALMETVADLKMLRRGIADNLGDIDGSLRETTLFNNDLHELIMATRMVSAITLEHRLQRTVRQAANQVSKKVALRFNDNDVKLDDQMINHLVDPLQHLLRNAVIHGLETSTERKKLDKPEIGNIQLDFTRDGNYLNITCSDNGRGLDRDKIFATAVAQGLIQDEENLTDGEIENLILQPGFSTATEITEMAGRGVGMDVVNTNIRKLKGNITINNSPGNGVQFILRVPMTMGILHCLVVETQEQVFAISVNNLNRVVHDGTKNVELMSNEWYYREEGLTCPIYELSTMLGLGESKGFSKEQEARPIILVNDISGTVAIAIDSVRVGRDLVIKNLGSFVGDVGGVLGASILGDGQVVYILEMLDLLEIQSQGHVTKIAAATTPTKATLPATGVKHHILVVDDSLSTRTSLSILLNDNNFDVLTAKDGLDAIEVVNQQKPDLILLDMEMPRMDGLEFTAHIRLHPSTKNIPIFMITSRTAEKHRNMAQKAGVDAYITKPYTVTELLTMIDAKLEAS